MCLEDVVRSVAYVSDAPLGIEGCRELVKGGEEWEVAKFIGILIGVVTMPL